MNYSVPPSFDNDLPSCLVAGGCGFIGYWLCQFLLDQNCNVFSLDKISTNRYDNRISLLENPHFKNLEQDIDNIKPSQLENLDYVFNIIPAQIALDSVDTNIQALISSNFYNQPLMELAKAKNAKYLLLTADSINQGIHLSLSQKQENQVLRVAIDFVENQTVSYYQGQNLNARIVRAAYIYGPRMSLESNNFISYILKNGEKTQKIELPEDGMETLYPTYIEDVISGIVKTIFSQSSNGKIFSLINNDPITLLNLTYCIKDFWQKDFLVEFASSHKLNLKALSEKAKQSQLSISWKPKYSLEKGLKKTLDFFIDKKQLSISPTKPLAQELKPKKITEKPLFKPEDKKIDFKKASSTQLSKKKTLLNPSLKPIPDINYMFTNDSSSKINLSPSVVNTSLISKVNLPSFNIKIKPKIRHLLFFVFILILVVSLPRIIFLSSINFASNTSDQLGQVINQNNDSFIQKKITASHRVITIGKFFKPLVYWQDNLFSINRNIALFNLVDYLPKLNGIYQNISKSNQDYIVLKNIVLGSQLQDPTSFYQNLLTNLNNVSSQISLLQLELIDENNQTNLSSQLTLLKQKVQSQIDLISIFPDLFSFSAKKNYLILIQDNHELRSTGGFISAVALMTVEKGKIINLEIKDVFEVELNFKGKVVPPAEFEKYQIENSWFFRDLNFAPSFSCFNIDYENGQHCTAGDAIWFAQKTFDQKIDGVIAINPVFFQNILSATGPIVLSDYSQEINSQNILEKIKNNAQTNENKFIVSLSQEIFNKIKNIEDTQINGLILAIYESLNHKDFLLYLPGTDSASQINDLNWGGNLRESPQNLLKFGPINLSDFLAIYENNFSFRKNNFYTQNSIDHLIEIDDSGTIISTSTFILKNNSETKTWPGGDYDKNYLRFLIPQDTILKQISISGKNLNSREIFKSTEGNYRSIGFLVSTKAGSESVVKLVYQHKKSLPIQDPEFNYSLYIQKQPGSFDAPLSLTISYPASLSVSKLSQQAEINQGKITYFETLDKDKVFAVAFNR